MRVNKAANDPRFPVLDDQDRAALRALIDGVANAGQQKHAITVIVQKICETNGLGWHPENERLTAFMQGKRMVGRTILGALVAPASQQESE